MAPQDDEIEALVVEKKQLLKCVTAQIKQRMASGDIDGALAVVEINCMDEDDYPDSASSLKGVLTQFKEEYTEAVRSRNDAQLQLLFDADFEHIEN